MPVCFFPMDLSRTIIYCQLQHLSWRRFLILAVVLPRLLFQHLVPASLWASVKRRTENPSCILPLKPPFNHRRATVWPREYTPIQYICTYIRICVWFRSPPLSSSEWNHGSTCRIVGLKIKGFKRERKSFKKKVALMILRRVLEQGILSFGFSFR